MAEDYQYEEKATCFEWKIENDTKDILGYNCRKATTQYRAENIQHGTPQTFRLIMVPMYFRDCLGLIMEIEDQKQHYHFIAIAMDKKVRQSICEMRIKFSM